ncbi:hypothetical protein HDU81_001304, partial [Chytriomyces hyalinus]
ISTLPVNEPLVQLLNHTTYNTGCANTAVEEATVHIIHSSTGNPNIERTAADGSDNGSANYAVFQLMQFSKEKNLANIALFFPSSFPFGVGGPGMQREVHLSPKNWAKICLSLFTGNFQRHWGFTAIVYNYIATREAFAKQYLSMRTANNLKTCYDHMLELENCSRLGRTAPQAPEAVNWLLDIKKQITPGLRAFIGSDESQSAHLHVAFGIQRQLATANMFITISPASS